MDITKKYIKQEYIDTKTIGTTFYDCPKCHKKTLSALTHICTDCGYKVRFKPKPTVHNYQRVCEHCGQLIGLDGLCWSCGYQNTGTPKMMESDL